jgi:hypothetical protein
VASELVLFLSGILRFGYFKTFDILPEDQISADYSYIERNTTIAILQIYNGSQLHNFFSDSKVPICWSTPGFKAVRKPVIHSSKLKLDLSSSDVGYHKFF